VVLLPRGNTGTNHAVSPMEFLALLCVVGYTGQKHGEPGAAGRAPPAAGPGLSTKDYNPPRLGICRNEALAGSFPT